MRRAPGAEHGTGPDRRTRGVTLAEVLMALGIMSIGVVSVMTLFPIAILRTLHATQLTNATILRHNAEARIEMRHDIVHDPDVDGNYAEHETAPANVYFVDPYGWNEMQIAGLQNFLGADGTGNPSLPARGRFHAGFNTPQLAQSLVSLPDSWIAQTEGIPTAFNAPPSTVVTMPAGANLASVVVGAGRPVSRVAIFDPTGRRSELRTITAIAGQDITFTPALPAAFPVGGTVKVFTEEPRYTWLATVRQFPPVAPNPSPGDADVTITVFAARRVSEADELAYPATFTRLSSTVDLNVPPTTKPHYKKGGWILDLDNGHWYRIQDVLLETPLLLRFRLDRPAQAAGTRAVLMRGIVEVFPLGLK